MRTVREIPVLRNIPVLVRAALNVPLQDLAHSYRLTKALPTLKFLREGGARVIVASHIGEEGTETLEPIAKALNDLLGGVTFCSESTGPKARAAARELPLGGILVLENLRRNAGEVKNDPAFAHELASVADVFVQDSFDTCHRAHASIVGVPKILPSYAGLQLETEVAELTKVFTPARPSLAIIGGVKFSTKEPVIMKLLASYDKVFVGGALANDFLKLQGHAIGRSISSPGNDESIRKLLDNPKLVLPSDCRVESGGTSRVATLMDIKPDEAIIDHGPATEALLKNLIAKTKMVLWNGPLGQYERGYIESTDAVARAIAESSAYSVIGGGDTDTELEKLGLIDKFSFVSTGGGAMLDFIAKGTLPGITALESHG